MAQHPAPAPPERQQHASPSVHHESWNWLDDAGAFFSTRSKTIVQNAEALWNATPNELLGASTSFPGRTVLMGPVIASAYTSASVMGVADPEQAPARANSAIDAVDEKLVVARAAVMRARNHLAANGWQPSRAPSQPVEALPTGALRSSLRSPSPRLHERDLSTSFVRSQFAPTKHVHFSSNLEDASYAS